MRIALPFLWESRRDPTPSARTNLCAFAFGLIPQISILSPQSVGSIQSTINASLHQTYNEFFSTPYHSMWLFTCHLRSPPKAASVHMAIVNFSIDSELYPVSPP